MPLESLTNALESLANALESLANALESLANALESLANALESLANVLTRPPPAGCRFAMRVSLSRRLPTPWHLRGL